MIIFATGHRPQKLQMPGIEGRVKQLFHWVFQTYKPTWFITGMALGVNQWSAEEALLLKVPVLAAIPCREQEKFWGKEAKGKYYELLSKVQAAGGATQYVTEGPYEKHVMQKRNEWMADCSNMGVAVFDGTSGGTANCVRYTLEMRVRANRPLPILKYDPVSSKSEWL